MSGQQQEPSRLWKAGMLATQSTNFRVMVEAAADQLGKPYDEQVLRKVSASPELLDMVDLSSGEGVDAVLHALATDPSTGGVLDQIIIDAVSAE